jgi:hypothetical protein
MALPATMEEALSLPPDTSDVINWDWALRIISGIEGDKEVNPDALEPGLLLELLGDFIPSCLDKTEAILKSAALFRAGILSMPYQDEEQWTEEVRRAV